MGATGSKTTLSRRVHDFVTEGFRLEEGRRRTFGADEPAWARLRDLGTELWLDTGSISEADKLWTRQFSALTTNNTLLNKEVQKGTYDSLIARAGQMLEEGGELSEEERTLEMAFILNARHALRLVEKFDAHVSVEEHTALASDVGKAVEYARRFYAICPQRFIVKIPFTPAGLLATRKAAAEGMPINHTLGFSARQNYVIARIGRPAFVNVFQGRLNSFVADNGLGSGQYIGEKATLASQRVVREVRTHYHTPSRQIGASFRSGGQVRDLAGIDVMTMPPKAAQEFVEMNLSDEEITDCTGRDYEAGIDPQVSAESVRLDTLWDIDEGLVKCVDELEKENLGAFTADDLVDFFAEHGCGDFMVKWSDPEVDTSAREGKIPRLENWKEPLATKLIGLDSLMNLAGLNSFATDQRAMDERVREVLRRQHAGAGAK